MVPFIKDITIYAIQSKLSTSISISFNVLLILTIWATTPRPESIFSKLTLADTDKSDILTILKSIEKGILILIKRVFYMYPVTLREAPITMLLIFKLSPV